MTAGIHGDQQLVARLGELSGPRHPVAAAAVVTPEGMRVAGRGTDLDADFESARSQRASPGCCTPTPSPEARSPPTRASASYCPWATSPPHE
jgi:hypothetical protein